MFKPFLLAGAMALSASFWVSSAYAQDHNGHDGHNHGAQPNPQAQNLPAPDFVYTEAPDDHAIGGDFAPITMITYASVTCGHCGNWFSNIWPEIKTELVETDKIRFVLRELPTAPAALSVTGFTMAECAPKADYMSVIEYQMENQKMIFEAAEKGEARAEYDKIGKLAGLENEADINACLADQDKLAHIHTNSDRANGAAIKGVPAFYINGESYEGEQDAKTLINLIKTMDEKGLSALPTSLPKR